MSKPKPKTKRSRGSAITDAARPAVPAIEAVEPVKVESPAAEPVAKWNELGRGEAPYGEAYIQGVSDVIRPQQDHATWRDVWKAAMTLAILFLGVVHLGTTNRIEDVSRDGKAQYDATRRQMTANEKNIGHVWHEMNVYGEYVKPDWSKDAGEIPAK